MRAQNAAGRSLAAKVDTSSESWGADGGSETSPTWANIPINALVKNNEADVVNSEMSMVKVRDSTRLGQRRSFPLHLSLSSKVKESGKYESNTTLVMPLRLGLAKSRC
ncbi:hypothetical protein ACMFMG_008566 [Clarireedia jacksonii]